jgi:hypothetical protein
MQGDTIVRIFGAELRVYLRGVFREPRNREDNIPRGV